MRAWLCVGMCAFKTNVSFSRFVFVLAENRKAGGGREEVEGGAGALNCAACGVRLYILFY